MADLKRKRDDEPTAAAAEAPTPAVEGDQWGGAQPASTKKNKAASSSGSGSSGDSRDDSVGHLLASPGERLGEYTVVSESGTGTFGKAYKCTHITTGVTVAIKVVRAIARYTDSAAVEARILTVVNRADPGAESRCVRYLSSFTHGAHMCMVFELLGPSVYDYLKQNKYRPLPLYCVQQFADQLVWAVAFLHAMELMHTDLKPENLLLSPTQFVKSTARTHDRSRKPVLAPECLEMRIIDFGGATFEHQHKSAIINTRQYRAPEVLLDCGWDVSSDMWSVGCILMEMYTGELLFATHDNLEHLALIEACLGPIPEHMTRTREARNFFDRHGTLLHRTRAPRDSLKHVAAMKSLREHIHPDDRVFYDLVKKCLAIDPRRRISAAEAVNHLFFTAVRGFRKPTVPAFTVPRNKQRHLDQASVDELSLEMGVASAAGGGPASEPTDDVSQRK